LTLDKNLSLISLLFLRTLIQERQLNAVVRAEKVDEGSFNHFWTLDEVWVFIILPQRTNRLSYDFRSTATLKIWLTNIQIWFECSI
jgi:hypothetical protein